MILKTRKCFLTDKGLTRHGHLKQLDFRGIVSGLNCILYIYSTCCKICLYCGSEIFFSEISCISPPNSFHKILIIISIFCTPFSALTSFFFWQITIGDPSLPDRQWVTSWEWNSIQNKEIKGESQENGGKGAPCRLCWLFCKYCVGVIKMASMDLRVGLKPTCISRGEGDTVKFYPKLLATQRVNKGWAIKLRVSVLVLQSAILLPFNQIYTVGNYSCSVLLLPHLKFVYCNHSFS